MFVKIISLLLIFSFAGGAIAATEQQAHNVKRVLVVDSYASSDLWTERLNQGIHEILNEKCRGEVITDLIRWTDSICTDYWKRYT